MDEYNVTRFFNQFIRTIKQGIKNIAIITDKDGTLLLDSSLRQILQSFKEKNLGVNVYVIANSGRTVQDMINCLEQENIPTSYFDYIIGDNGGMCIDVKRDKQLYKHVMDRNVVQKVIDKFFDMGGNPENIRISDGSNIFAYPSEDVKEYYKYTKDVVFKKDISDLNEIDITKLTLTGPHEQINKINKYIRDNIKGYKTHVGKTFFPIESKNNYRIDFTRNAYKRTSFCRFKRDFRTRYLYLSWK